MTAVVTFSENISKPAHLDSMHAALDRMVDQANALGLSTSDVEVAIKDNPAGGDMRESWPGSITITATVKL